MKEMVREVYPQFDIELFKYYENIYMQITLHGIAQSNTVILCISIIERQKIAVLYIIRGVYDSSSHFVVFIAFSNKLFDSILSLDTKIFYFKL